MYRILLKKSGKPNNRNVLRYNYVKYPSKYVLMVVAKKTLQGSKTFTLSSKVNYQLFKSLDPRELKKSRVELYLTLTGHFYNKYKEKIITIKGQLKNRKIKFI